MPLKKIKYNVHKTFETWVIPNISHAVQPRKSKTPLTHKFSTEFEGNITKWYIELKKWHSEPCEEIEILFDAVNEKDVKNHVTCNFYVVDADDNLFFIGRRNRKLNSRFYYPAVIRKIFGKCACFSFKRSEKIIPNDTMTLRIELITYLDDNPTFPLESAGSLIDVGVNLPNTFLEFYESGKDNGDIVIQVQDTQFKVHRIVLETRCPVLYEDVARHQQTPESKGTELNITDINPEIFKRLLEFLYTGKINDLDDHSEYLLEASDRYKLKRLKQLCEKSLADNYLTVDNYEEVGSLAYRCRALQLTVNCILLESNLIVKSMDKSIKRTRLRGRGHSVVN